MKRLLSTIALVFLLGFGATAQLPYVEYSTDNYTLENSERTVATIRYIIDNTNPIAKKTYVFYQKAQGTPVYVPNVPSGWVTYVGDFEANNTLHFNTNGVVFGIIDENGSFYIKVNGN